MKMHKESNLEQSYDGDLRSIQQARRLVEHCRSAQRQFADASAKNVEMICEAMAEAAFKDADRLAQLAHEETGYGVAADKVVKNRHAAKGVWDSIRNAPTVGVVSNDPDNRMQTVAVPMGVVAALTPSTNPTSTAIFKCLIAVRGRNGIVISPHPSAARCTREAVATMANAAQRAGAPAGLIACMDALSLAGTQELLAHRAVNVVLATGGGPMVRAAHRSGKPAYGVGPGNVPVWVDHTADVAKVARDLVASKSFDCSLICATEQTVVVDSRVAGALRKAMQAAGAYWVPSNDIPTLAARLFHPDGSMRVDSVGQSAIVLAESIGLKVPEGTRVLIAELEGVGREHPLSREKLTSVLGFMSVEGRDKGIETCVSILEFGGEGHSAVIHAQDKTFVESMASRLPAFRIIVNSMSTLGSVGYTCGFVPSFTLGTGGVGGAIVGDNITATHLVNYKRIG